MDEPDKSFLGRGPTPINTVALIASGFSIVLILLVDFRNPALLVSSLCAGFFFSRIAIK